MADHVRFDRFHAITLFWYALIITFDDCGLAIAGIALPPIMKNMSVMPTSADLMAGAALFSMVFDAIFLGTIVDRIGRRWAIAVCIVLFNVSTVTTGFPMGPVIFSVARFLAGFDIGSVVPNIVTQMAECSLRRARSMLVTFMFSDHSVGGMLAAPLGKDLLEHYGRQSMFIMTVLLVLLVPTILRQMSESIPFPLCTGKFGAVRDIVRRLDPNDVPQPGDASIPSGVDRGNSAPPGRLFQDGRGFGATMFWIAFFMRLFVACALNSWLTKLVASVSYSLSSALTSMPVLNFGVMLGVIGDGWLADRFNVKYVPMAMYALVAMSIALLGIRTLTEALYLLVAVADGCTIGMQIVTYAYAGQFYPMSIRSTGIGWALGVGRNGAILAPIVIGMLVGMALPLHRNSPAVTVLTAITTIAMAFINRQRSASITAR